MDMLEIAVVDDDLHACGIIKNEINKVLLPEQTEYKLHVYDCANRMLNAKEVFDMIFLDIDMPGRNGLETAKLLQIKGSHSIIIFITSKISYMKDAFGLNVFGFIEKSEIEAILPRMIKKCIQTIEDRILLTFKINGGILSLRKDEIRYATFENRKVSIYTKQGKHVVNLTSLQLFYDMVDHKTFVYINRSTIVNLMYLLSTKEDQAVLRECKETLPISKDRRKEVNIQFLDWISNRGIV